MMLAAGCGRLGFDAPFEASPAGTDGARAGDAAHDGSSGDVAVDAMVPLVPRFATVCTFASFGLIQDAISIDDAAGMEVATASAQACGGTASVAAVAQGDPGVLDASGRPLFGPTRLAVLGGGDANQLAVQYLDMADTPLVPMTGANRVQLLIRATGAFALDVAANTYGMRHDVGYVQVTLEPIGDTLVLSAIGHTANGTTAAGLWFDANRASILAGALQWIVVDWQDTDATSGPSAGDTFTVVASG